MATTPIVTEVTLAELEALVAANGLNEGLQYKVTDKNWLLIATGDSTYSFASIPYKSYIAFLTNNGITDIPEATVLKNDIGDVVWSKPDGADGAYVGTLIGAFGTTKTSILLGSQFNIGGEWVFGTAACNDNDTVLIQTVNELFVGINGCLFNTLIEIKVYLI